MMDVKTQIADYAREFYHKPITPYDFVMARIDNSDFSLFQLFRDDQSTKALDLDYNVNFIFAYEVPRDALNTEIIPALNEEELKHVNVTTPKAANGIEEDEAEETKGWMEETKEDQPMNLEPRKFEVIPPQQLFRTDWIQIPVKPLIRSKKQTSSYSYSYSYNSSGPKFENQNVIPRIFWFKKTATPFEVLKQIINQYSFVLSDEPETHDPEAFFQENFKPLIDYLADPEKA